MLYMVKLYGRSGLTNGMWQLNFARQILLGFTKFLSPQGVTEQMISKREKIIKLQHVVFENFSFCKQFAFTKILLSKNNFAK